VFHLKLLSGDGPCRIQSRHSAHALSAQGVFGYVVSVMAARLGAPLAAHLGRKFVLRLRRPARIAGSTRRAS
jgi:hypothetical protein